MRSKILVADDEHEVVTTIADILKENNYDVVTAFDGTQVVQMAHKEKPDLIIMDIIMPAGAGIGAYENLKKSSKTAIIPVIFITCDPYEETRNKVTKMGAKGFIYKPFTGEMLLAEIEKVFKGSAMSKGTTIG
ncbi:MAG: response regulator [Candidatus Eremiobacteraeota bacterium]|nr:response regulator [Candidatus Eremiobacteraeota bacterium]